MRRALSLALFATLISTLGACGPAGDDSQAAITYHRDIRPLFEARCESCHTTGNIGPFALDSYQAVFDLKESVAAAVAAKTMPPYLPDSSCRDYVGDPSLSAAEIDMVKGWVADGAPEGDPADYTPMVVANPAPQLARVDAVLEMPVEYTPQNSPDDYRCFVLDWNETTPVYVTGFRTKPGNLSIVHHVIAFGFKPGGVDKIKALDAAEAGAGYTCYGDPGGDYREMFTLGAWAPGGTDAVMPEGIGLKVEPGSIIVIQVHYNTLNGMGSDRSAVEIQLEPSVEREGAILWWTNFFEWTNGTGMKIPAGEASVTHGFPFDPTQYMSTITSGVIPSNSPFEIHSAAHHMHQLGTRGYQAVRRGKSENNEECLLEVPRWDFAWQDTFRFQQPLTFNPGDDLYLECEWDNTPGNQGWVDGAQLEPRDVFWGEGTQDEMCLGVFMVTNPKAP